MRAIKKRVSDLKIFFKNLDQDTGKEGNKKNILAAFFINMIIKLPLLHADDIIIAFYQLKMFFYDVITSQIHFFQHISHSINLLKILFHADNETIINIKKLFTYVENQWVGKFDEKTDRLTKPNGGELSEISKYDVDIRTTNDAEQYHRNTYLLKKGTKHSSWKNFIVLVRRLITRCKEDLLTFFLEDNKKKKKTFPTLNTTHSCDISNDEKMTLLRAICYDHLMSL